MAQQQNYQPQPGNTTNGPNIHTYIPRSDGTITISGVVYAPQASLPTIFTSVANSPVVPVTITAAPAVVTPIATVTVPPSAPAVPMQSYFTPPGGPSVPVGPAGYSVFCPSQDPILMPCIAMSYILSSIEQTYCTGSFILLLGLH